MTHITILGDGTMGQAIAGIVAKGGTTVEVFGSSDQDQSVTGSMVILAVPYPAVEQILSDRSGQLDGRVVVDITNPLNFETFDSLVVAPDGSAAQELAGKLPQSKVLKAFNTNFAATLQSATVGGEVPTTVLVAGDDQDAKQTLIGIVCAGGLKALDVGSLKRARELEALGFLQLTLAADDKVPWSAGFAVIS